MTEINRADLPPHLAALSDKDLEGLQRRAKREGVPIEELKIRQSLPPGAPELPLRKQIRRDVEGILGRLKKERKTLRELPLRRTDDPLALADAMAEMCIKAGFPVKVGGDQPLSGRWTARNAAVLDKEELSGEDIMNKEGVTDEEEVED